MQPACINGCKCASFVALATRCCRCELSDLVIKGGVTKHDTPLFFFVHLQEQKVLKVHTETYSGVVLCLIHQQKRQKRKELKMYQSPNADIKLMMKQRHVRQWQIAKKLEINECTFSKKIARERLPEDFKESVIKAIEDLSC